MSRRIALCLTAAVMVAFAAPRQHAAAQTPPDTARPKVNPSLGSMPDTAARRLMFGLLNSSAKAGWPQGFSYGLGNQPFGASADPLANAFFPPELVMQHQQRIGLTAEQRSAIIRAIQDAQPRFIEAQWQLEPETAALAELLRGPRVDQQRVLQQIDRILDIERRIKRSQIELLVAIKNQLTEQQQGELARLGGARGILQYQGAAGGIRR